MLRQVSLALAPLFRLRWLASQVMRGPCLLDAKVGFNGSMVRQYLHLSQANVVFANIRVLAHNALNSTEICGKKCILLKFSLALSRLWLSHLVLLGNGFERRNKS